MKTFADSVHDARKGMAAELAGQAEQIQKLTRELTELQLRHERTEREASHHWETLASAAAATTAEYESRVTPEAALEGVLGAVRGLMTATLPEQVFETLTEEAAQFGVRAAIFDVRGKAAWGASSHGFGSALTDKVLRSLIVPLTQDSPFRQVCETAGDVEASTETLRKNRNVLDRLKPATHAPILLLPVRSAGTVTAIFYADPGESGKPLPVSALKILAEFAGAQIDRLIALGGGFADEETSAEPAEPLEAIEPAESVSAAEHVEAIDPVESIGHVTAAEATAVEEQVVEAASTEVVAEIPAALTESHAEEPAAHADAIAGQVSDVPAVDRPVIAEIEAQVANTEAVGESFSPPAEIEMESAAPEVAEPMDPPLAPVETREEVFSPPEHSEVEAVRSPMEHFDEPVPVVAALTEDQHVSHDTEPAVAAANESVPVESSPGVVVEEQSAPVVPADFDVTQLSEAEQKTHKDAKRFAKLLVSEIELYNKAKVADGRRNQDLYRRLKTDIDRSRVTFEKRFGKSVSKQVDYFNDEMVKILAANDPAVLGPEYPGPAA